MIEADDGPLDVGDVTAEQVGRFNDPAEALRQGRVQRNLAQVVQEPADERFRRIDLDATSPAAAW